MTNTLDIVWNTDLVTLCEMLEPQSVDMILADVPYGTTACAWDKVIPFEPMWAGFKRVIKPRGAIVMTASQPFTSRLVCSNLGMFRYEWVWERNKSSNFLQANYQPIKRHENILIFSDGYITYTPNGMSMEYYPIFEGKQDSFNNGQGTDTSLHAWKARRGNDYQLLSVDNPGKFPSSLLKIPSDPDTLHPTQKPVALFEYLIRTYTQPGDVVLDPTCGSGTTAIAARNTGRHFICGDLELKYVEVARKRLAQDYTLPMFETLGVPA